MGTKPLIAQRVKNNQLRQYALVLRKMGDGLVWSEDFRRILGVTENTARKYSRYLRERGLVEQISGKKEKAVVVKKTTEKGVILGFLKEVREYCRCGWTSNKKRIPVANDSWANGIHIYSLADDAPAYRKPVKVEVRRDTLVAALFGEPTSRPQQTRN